MGHFLLIIPSTGRGIGQIIDLFLVSMILCLMETMVTFVDEVGELTICCLICGALYTQQVQEDEESVRVKFTHRINCALAMAWDVDIKH